VLALAAIYEGNPSLPILRFQSWWRAIHLQSAKQKHIENKQYSASPDKGPEHESWTKSWKSPRAQDRVKLAHRSDDLFAGSVPSIQYFGEPGPMVIG
jgi:hypothetical protein